MPPLADVDEAAATELLSWLLSTGLVYAGQGKYARAGCRSDGSCGRVVRDGRRCHRGLALRDGILDVAFCDYILASALAASVLSARRLFAMPTAIRTYAFPFSTLTDANPS